MTTDLSVPDSTEPPAAAGRRFSLRWLLLVAAALMLWRLDYAPFWNPDEGRYAAASMEMVAPIAGESPNWIVPHLNTLPRLNKPPLVYWLTAISFTLFGLSEWAARLVPALAAIAIMLVVWRLGRSMFGEGAGLLCSLVWATSAFPFAMARTLNTDMLLCLSTAITLAGMWWAIGEGPEQKSTHCSGIRGDVATPVSAWPYATAGVGMGLALLAKGPVGVALPLAIGFIYLCSVRGWGRVGWGGVLLAVAIAGGVALPWYLAIEQREPGFLRHFLVGENLGRFSGKEEYHDAKGFWFYLPVVALGLLPWIAFLPQAAARWNWPAHASRNSRRIQGLLWSLVAVLSLVVLIRVAGIAQYASLKAQKRDLLLVNTIAPVLLLLSIAVRCRLQPTLPPGLRGSLLFLWLWALLPVALFSLSSTKLITYVLVSFPAFALLLGEAVATLDLPQWRSVRRNRLAMGLTLSLNAALAVGALIFLTGQKTVPRSVGLPLAVAGCALLLVSTVASCWAWRAAVPGPRVRRLAGTHLVGAGALYLFLMAVAGNIAPYEDASQLIKTLRPHLREGDRFVEFKTFQPAAIFYLNRPVTVIDFVNTSGLDAEEFGKSQWFPPRPVIRDLLQQKGRVFALVRWKHIEMDVLKGAHRVGRNNDFFIVSNQPKPPGLNFEWVAPRKRSRAVPTDLEAGQ